MKTIPAWLVSLAIIAVPFCAYSEDLCLNNADCRTSSYLPLLKHQRVAVFANSSSVVNDKNIVDVLIDNNIDVRKIFSPEHGFSGTADAGSSVTNSTMLGSQISIISLYGNKNKPSATDLADIDVLVFDVQDVGVRFYTYISSLQKLMEAATEQNKPLIVLDRANPNAYYIDGPVLDKKFKSFVGMQPVPIVYGMTIGEYAKMLQGEEWLELSPGSKAKTLKLTVIPLEKYRHSQQISLSVKPSPNLPNMTSIYWYPSLGLFEGTKLSVGRGTAMPFQVLGSPAYTEGFAFTPKSTPGALNPPFKNQLCHGWDLRMDESSALAQTTGKIQLGYLLKAYRSYPDKATFFTSFINKLAGTDQLRQQVISGASESQIRASWQPALRQFKQIRKKYLLYPDN